MQYDVRRRPVRGDRCVDPSARRGWSPRVIGNTRKEVDMTEPKELTIERDLAHDADAFETEAGISDLLRAYDQAEAAYLRLALPQDTSVISYSINSQPMVAGRAIAE